MRKSYWSLAITCCIAISANITFAEGALSTNNITKNQTAMVDLGKHSITKLQTEGPVNITLSDSKRSNIILRGSPQSLASLSEQITNNSFAIKNPTDKPINLSLGGKALTTLNATESTVHSNRITITHPLNITANGDARINLTGMIDVNSINAADDANITLSWVNSPNLTIDAAGRSHLQLSGHVQTSNIHLADYAALEARSLTTVNNKTKTEDHALANIKVMNTLRAFASNDSGIYYTAKPAHLTRSSLDQANILELK